MNLIQAARCALKTLAHKMDIAPLLGLSVAAGFAYAGIYNQSFAESVGVAIAAVTVFYYCVWRGWIYPVYVSELRKVPTVPGFPLWGQFFEIITEECGIPQRRWHRRHGPIIRYYFPFGSERLSVADDESLKHITVRNPYNYPKPVRAKLWMLRILGEGVLLAEGHEHAQQRKALLPAFSIQALRALLPVFWEKGIMLGDLWRREMEEIGEPAMTIEILEWLNRCTLDIIGKAGFGYDIDCLHNPDLPIRHAYRLVFNFDLASRALHGLQAFFPWSKYIPAQMNRDMSTARAIILNKATEIITRKLGDADTHTRARDILALIAKENKALKADGETGLSFETMRDQIMTFLGAGHDTTATAVVWTVHLLARHPDVQARVRDEIRRHLPFLFSDSGRRDAAGYAKADPDLLPYLDRVCRESLRFIPPIPLTVRQSLRDDRLGRYHVPAGTVVYMLANAINRLPAFWGRTVDEFDPDRWEKLPETATPNAYMTFLHGPRSCIGRKFAEIEMKVLLCSLLSLFEFSPDYNVADPEELKMWRLVLRPRDGLSVRVKLLKPHL